MDAFIPENPFGTPGAPGKPEQIGGDFDNFEVKYEVIFETKNILYSYILVFEYKNFISLGAKK